MTDAVLLAAASFLMLASALVDKAAADAIAPIVLLLALAVAAFHLRRGAR